MSFCMASHSPCSNGRSPEKYVLQSNCRRFCESCFVLFQVQATHMSNSKLAVGYCTSPRLSTGN